MTLRLRIRHALGEREVQIVQEDGEHPHIFGRGREADVVVTGVGVLRRHLAVFFDAASDRWLVQDGNTRGRTRVNGIALPDSTQPCPLLEGFVVTLGDSDDTCVVTVLGIDPPAIKVVPEVEATPANATPRTRRQRKTNAAVPAVLTAAIVLAFLLGLVVGSQQTSQEPLASDSVTTAGFERRQPSLPATRGAATTLPSTPPEERRRPLLPTLQGEAASIDLTPNADLRTRGEVLEETADPAGVRGFVAGLSPEDPLRASAAWADVIRAESQEDVALQLQTYLDYTSLPQSRTGDLRFEVASRLERTLDRLWWQRIADLLEEEFAVIDDALAAELELRGLAGPDTAERAQSLRERLADGQKRLAMIDAELAEDMKYDAGEVPRLGQRDQLSRLRGRRDDDAYAAWRSTVLAVAQQGRLPWDVRPTTRPAS